MYLLACVISALPDADAFLYWSGVPYGHPLGHRGLSHSPAFALVVAAVLSLAFLRARRWTSCAFLFVVGASHGVLDAMTDGGLGVAFLAPIGNSRYFLPWRPLVAPPIGVMPFFSMWGVEVLKSELVWVWAPLLVVLVAVEAKRRRPHTRPGDTG